MTTKKHKLLSACLGLLLMGLVLSGCGCDHDWQKATCLAPRTCSICGATEGKVRSHEWGSTACHDPQPCIVCGTMEGMELTHEWREDCKICIHCGHDERPAEDRFPDRLAEGLQARWAIEKSFPEDPEYVRTKEDWTSLFAAEYDQLAVFLEESFEDEAVEAAAHRYVKSIKASMEALEYFGTDRWDDEYHNGVYQEQTVALFLYNQIHPVTVAEEYQQNLEDMLVNGEIINLVMPLFDQIMFLPIMTSRGLEKYETTLTNTTSLTFKWFSLDVNLLDKDGNVLAVETCKVTNWKDGQKKRFSFTSEESFSGMEVKIINWELPR